MTTRSTSPEGHVLRGLLTPLGLIRAVSEYSQRHGLHSDWLVDEIAPEAERAIARYVDGATVLSRARPATAR